MTADRAGRTGVGRRAPASEAGAAGSTALLVLPGGGSGTSSCSSPRSRSSSSSASATRAPTGGYAGGFTLDNYAARLDEPGAVHHEPHAGDRRHARCACSSACRSRTSSRRAPGERKGLLIVLLVIPFWTSFLIRTYAWLMILGPDRASPGSSAT